ncbi:MAG: DUF739 domain-containing protein [Eubacteriales bacterium]|nr:DUF739 domain-containing protein [Eubacteriales bacterium]
MLRKDLLRQWIADNHMTMCQLANGLGLTSRTLYSRMKKGDFRLEEVDAMIHMLHMTNPCEVFFNLREH